MCGFILCKINCRLLPRCFALRLISGAVAKRPFENMLKVPKHEHFFLAFFALSETHLVIWLRDWKKFDFFINWLLILMVFGFSPHSECAVNKNKIWSCAKIESWWWLLWDHELQCFFWKFLYRIPSTRKRFFTTYSVHIEYFLPHTQ